MLEVLEHGFACRSSENEAVLEGMRQEGDAAFAGMSLSKRFPRVIHKLSEPNGTRDPWLDFVMTASRRDVLRVWVRYLGNMADGHAAGLDKKLHLLVGQPGVGKTTLLAAVNQAILSIFPPATMISCYFSFREDNGRHVLPSELIHLALCRSNLLDPDLFFVQPRDIHQVLRFIQERRLSFVLILDEVQEAAKWEDVEAVVTFSEQLGFLQRTSGSIMTICSGSSVYCSKLLTGRLSDEAVELGQFRSYRAFKPLEQGKIFSLRYFPISLRAEFEEVVQNMVNPLHVSYRSELWSLEYLDTLDAEDTMDVDVEIDEASRMDLPVPFTIPDPVLMTLFSASGGILRGLNALVDGRKDEGRRQLRAPTDMEVQKQYQDEIGRLRSVHEAHPYAHAILQQLFDGTCAILKGDKLSNYDLFELPMLDVGLLRDVTQAQLSRAT